LDAQPFNQALQPGQLGGTPNQPPTIASLSDSPDPVTPVGTVTLTANGVSDPDGAATVAAVRFYRESNNVPGLQATAAAGGVAGVLVDIAGAKHYIALPIAVAVFGACCGGYETAQREMAAAEAEREREKREAAEREKREKQEAKERERAAAVAAAAAARASATSASCQ
jgi:hypothetical protein